MMTGMPAVDEPEAVVSLLWQEHTSEPWPTRLTTAERAGVDLVNLDSQLSGCVQTWLNHRSAFDARKLNALRRLLGDLEQVLPELTEEDHPRIWQRHRQMARLISDSSPHVTS